MVSVPIWVIFILFIVITPFSSVVYSTASPSFIFTVNFAPSRVAWFNPSTLTSCRLYEPVIFSFGIVTIINPELLYIFELILGITLLIMGLNNYLIYKRKNLTILYLIIGLGSSFLAILKLLGL